ncbi:hypothetical protein Vi05172_g8979 [Venturia inaequalis]|nr:hypothetical protein Vi05172_g8979 [Venturia inaequalis]
MAGHGIGDTERQTTNVRNGNDEETANTTTEETPLLANQRADSTEQSEHDPASEPKTRSWYLWRLFWLLIAALIIGVFIQGWINAGGDVDYRFGTTFTAATKTLYRDGGVRRYYQGIGAALVQGPVSRFGDTAANAGILAFLQSNSYLSGLPSPIKTIFASLCAAAFRMILTPVDTLKTTLQVQGARGTSLLRQRIKVNGLGSLWWGAFATAAATFVGHYPWFATYNYLSETIPEPAKHPIIVWLLRLAFIGFVASVVSDSVSNSLRVVKTYRQVSEVKVGYVEAARLVIREDGLVGLFGRGLKTRILCNGLQGLLFSILWKLFLDLWDRKTSS